MMQHQTSVVSTRAHTGRDSRTRRTGIVLVRLVVVATLSLGANTPRSWAGQEEQEIPFAEAHLFFELNDTDGDLGIHALIDGDAWENLEIEDLNEHRLLLVSVIGRLKDQGLTEVFFESAEPPFEELEPEVFFRRFPAGIYEIGGKTIDGRELESKVELTHVMPAPPEPTVNGMPMAVQCDDGEPNYDATEVSGPVTIAWLPVTLSHPNPNGGGAGVQPPIPVTIHNYEVVVEAEIETNGATFTSVFSIILPPDVTSITIPEAFLDLSNTFKYEVLAREKSYNQTAVESCFVLVD